MSQISAAAVMALRNRTNAPMMECKSALTESNGDMDKAADILRKRNKAIQDKKGDRETAEGRIGSFVDPVQRVGALVEMRCESAPVAKSEHFVTLANDLARQVAQKGATAVDALLSQPYIDDANKTVNDRIGDVVGMIRENMKLARMVRMSGILGNYVHHDGRLGVMVQVEGERADLALLRDVCMHIAAKNPIAIRREDIGEETIAREKDIARTQAAATGKPEKIVESIAEGKMKAWYGENVLLEQPFVKDPTHTIGKLLDDGGLKLIRFVRLQVGDLS